MINKICFSNRYIDLINKFFKQLCIISYIYIVYSLYEDNNRILVFFSMCPEKIYVAKSVKII